MTSDKKSAGTTASKTTKPLKKAAARKSAPRTIALPENLTVQHLSELFSVNPIDVIKQLMRNGIMASINQTVDFQLAALIASELGIRVKLESHDVTSPSEQPEIADTSETTALQERPPVVIVLGHVDHGKTTLLDTIRKASVAAKEIGGITQHIGAYQVEHSSKLITFLDTPGHEAFTAIRARGAHLADIAILVVAADDGVMPQTVEALNHVNAAGLPIIVAINKMDIPNADIDRTKRQLAEHGVLFEEWGGEVIAIPISAKLNEGIDDLLDTILLVSELAELRANPDNYATGVVIESQLDKNRGPLATVLIHNGTLKVGDYVVAGSSWGRTRALISDKGARIQEAGPSAPIEIMGFSSLPDAGDTLAVAKSERAARESGGANQRNSARLSSGVQTLTLEGLNAQLKEGVPKELNLVIKADVQGSAEAAVAALGKLDNDRAKVRVLHSASGSISESDVLLASASKAIIVGFSTTAQLGVDRVADREGVEIRHYRIIYHLVEDIEKALEGILEATYREVTQGHLEIRAVFSSGRKSKIAGCRVLDGRINRNALARVVRDNQVLYDGPIASLRHFKEEVSEMTAGYECGVSIANFMDFEEGDTLEIYRREKGRA